MIKCLSLIFFISNFSWANGPIVVSSKNFSESMILAEMTALLLEEKFYQPVIRKFNLGGTQVAFDALKQGAIHVYPDYTGTGYVMILKMDEERDPDKVYQIVNREFRQRWGITWSPPMGFNNTFALVVRRDDPKFRRIKKISDLSRRASAYKYASIHEFMERKDGHARLSSTYQLNFQPKNVMTLEAGLLYSAIQDKSVDMIVTNSTDGRNKSFNLRILEDDRQFFPPYYVALIAKENTLESFPALRETFSLMKDLITEDEMMEMNDWVDRLKLDYRIVAKNFLIEKGLLAGKVNETQKRKNLIEYFISKRVYLLKLLKEHLLLSFGALFFALVLSLPLGILMTRFSKLSKLVFPLVNTIQTIPSLALLGFLIPVMGIGLAPALFALFLYSLLPLVRNTYTGILGVDRSYIEASRGIGLTNLQILTKVELPMAMPVILAGLRTAAVIVIGTATLAALIGAGGFGDPIFRGVSTVNSQLILLGAIPSALLAILVDKMISVSEKFLVSKGIRMQTRR